MINFATVTLPSNRLPAGNTPAGPFADSGGTSTAPAASSPATPAAQIGSSPVPLDWRWPIALLLLWMALTAMYELGAPQLAVGLAGLIAFGSLMLFGPGAMAEITNLVGGK